jgi:N-methylhydantoinase B/oxoprolinase/acetone carboxylase alpha subunit
VLEDVMEGLVSIESAKKDYGVVLASAKGPEPYALDIEATRKTREGLRK